MVFPPHRARQVPRLNQINSINNRFQSPTQHYHPTQGSRNVLNQIKHAKPALTEMASKGIGGISKTLTNVQQVLKVVETTAPLVQQYGPFVKNLPAMLKMLKAFNESDSQIESEHLNESVDLNQEIKSTEYISPEKEFDSGNDENIESKSEDIEYRGQSTPKLFI